MLSRSDVDVLQPLQGGTSTNVDRFVDLGRDIGIGNACCPNHAPGVDQGLGIHLAVCISSDIDAVDARQQDVVPHIHLVIKRGFHIGAHDRCADRTASGKIGSIVGSDLGCRTDTQPCIPGRGTRVQLGAICNRRPGLPGEYGIQIHCVAGQHPASGT